MRGDVGREAWDKIYYYQKGEKKMMNLLVPILLALISVVSVAFEVLYFEEKARRKDEERMYLEHRERWLEICERQKKKIEELEDEVVNLRR